MSVRGGPTADSGEVRRHLQGLYVTKSRLRPWKIRYLNDLAKAGRVRADMPRNSYQVIHWLCGPWQRRWKHISDLTLPVEVSHCCSSFAVCQRKRDCGLEECPERQTVEGGYCEIGSGRKYAGAYHFVIGNHQHTRGRYPGLKRAIGHCKGDGRYSLGTTDSKYEKSAFEMEGRRWERALQTRGAQAGQYPEVG